MAKRFTDTDKWKKESFGELSLKMKLVWVYLCDNCDHTGIWDANFKLLAFQLGEEVTREEMETPFGDKIQWLGITKLHVPSFVEFQYGHLNPDNRVHKSVLIRLEKEGAIKGLRRPLEGAKDKATAKDLDKDKDKEPENSEALITLLPPKLKESMAEKFDDSWLVDEMARCFEWFTVVSPATKPKSHRGWIKAASGWIGRAKNPVLRGQKAAGDIC